MNNKDGGPAFPLTTELIWLSAQVAADAIPTPPSSDWDEARELLYSTERASAYNAEVSRLTPTSAGMTLRDKFAEAALPAEMARAFRIMADGATEEGWRDSVANRCYEQADAMLRAREA